MIKQSIRCPETGVQFIFAMRKRETDFRKEPSVKSEFDVYRKVFVKYNHTGNKEIPFPFEILAARL